MSNPVFGKGISMEPMHPIMAVKEPQVNLMTWLQQVAFHSQSTSYEDIQSLKALSLNIPNIDNASEEMKDVFERVKVVVEKQTFDPNLSPKSKQAYQLIHDRLAEKPKCARQLFSSDSEDWK